VVIGASIIEWLREKEEGKRKHIKIWGEVRFPKAKPQVRRAKKNWGVPPKRQLTHKTQSRKEGGGGSKGNALSILSQQTRSGANKGRAKNSTDVMVTKLGPQRREGESGGI